MTNQMTRSNYTLVTLAYWAFMLTDGALRMVVLFKFHKMGFSPIQLAFMFLLYEFAGILTNFIGGWIGARFGLRKTLFLGLLTQIIALTALSVVSLQWTATFSLVYVMTVQGLAGIAKDLTKMSSKSSVKLLIPKREKNAEAKLFFWVAFLTGLKNTLKGIGFFLGTLLFTLIGYENSLQSLASLLLIVLITCLVLVKSEFGKTKSKPNFTQLFSKSSAINRLSFARSFLFASRDVWFVVAVPIFLHEQLSWTFEQVGAFMATWVIGYGLIQASAPKIARATTGMAAAVKAARLWGFLLIAACMLIPLVLLLDFYPGLSLLLGLGIFGFIFAINSSVHSYLILAYTTGDDVSLNVGFYYMANATGRFMGTLLSGVMYYAGGIQACLWTAVAMCSISAFMSLKFPTKIEAN